MVGLLVVGLVIGLIFIGPFLLIWSLNVLLGAGIAMSFKTWIAALVLMSLLRGVGSSSK